MRVEPTGSARHKEMKTDFQKLQQWLLSSIKKEQSYSWIRQKHVVLDLKRWLGYALE